MTDDRDETDVSRGSGEPVGDRPQTDDLPEPEAPAALEAAREPTDGAANGEHAWVREIPDFEAPGELAAASRLMNRNLFGNVAMKRLPFSRQLLTEIEEAFPVDADMFKAVAKSHREYQRGFHVAFTVGTGFFAVLLALWVVFFAEYVTLALNGFAFEATSRTSWFFTAEGAPGLFGQTFDAPLWLYALVYAVAIIGAGVAARRVIRFLLLREIRNNARDLDSMITQRYELILARVIDTSGKISSARSKPKWHRRAHHWTIITQWNAKRAEYIDRYFSTIGWKIWLFNAVWELVYAGVRLGLIIAAHIWLFAVLSDRFPSEPQSTLYLIVLAAGVGFAAYAAFFWFFLDRKANTTWGDVAAANVQASERGRVHEWERLAEAVETAVKNIIDVQARG